MQLVAFGLAYQPGDNCRRRGPKDVGAPAGCAQYDLALGGCLALHSRTDGHWAVRQFVEGGAGGGLRANHLSSVQRRSALSTSLFEVASLDLFKATGGDYPWFWGSGTCDIADSGASRGGCRLRGFKRLACSIQSEAQDVRAYHCPPTRGVSPTGALSSATSPSSI